MKAPAASRVLAAVLRPSRDLAAFAIVVLGCAVFDGLRRPHRFDECYALALIFQMFSASTGFRERAVRGHFDPLLTRSSRRSIAAAHLVVSAAAGAMVWLLVAAIDAVLLRRFPPTAFEPAALIAFACVSLVAWALGLALPRYGAGVFWLLAMVVLAGSGYATTIRRAMDADPTWVHQLEGAAACVVAPMLLFARPAEPPVVVLLAVPIAACLAALIGGWYICRFDAALEEIA